MLTPTEVARQRACNQRLTGAPFERVEEVVRWFGAVQSQDYAGAKWALAQRTRDATNSAIDAAFNAGTLLRTHVMRPTWHFVLPADIRWLLALTGPRVTMANASAARKLGLDEATFARSNALIANALAGGKHLTRAEMARMLQEGGIAAAEVRLVHLMMRAELDGLICSGPLRGKQFTYALLDERAPATHEWTREEALAELTARYFTSHGPATAHDYAWWSGLTVADARAGIAMVAPRLLHEVVDGTTYWFPEPAAAAGSEEPIVRLLPNYDEHLVAYRDRSATFDAARLPDLDAKDPALLANSVVLNGHVIGGWRRTVQRGEIVIEASLRIALDQVQTAALHAAADTYGRFMGKPVALVIAPPPLISPSTNTHRFKRSP